ncbi:MAG: GNAT family N-acetyltransferase [Proteobacteria bacterium]|nr:GNAT family N-acetyltransferase [Pseudomonadota bacterium]
MSANEIIYQIGLPEQFRSDAVKLYDEAFGKKISVAIRSDESRKLLLNNCLMLEYSIIALSNGELIGIAGFNTLNGSLTGGITYQLLRVQLGFIKGNWAALIFSLYSRKPKQGELVMDGIAVQADFRGKGVGSRLLEEMENYATKHEFNSIRLDVIDINSKAKKLYERKGFKVVKIEHFPYLRRFLGFGGNTTMKLSLEKNASKDR